MFLDFTAIKRFHFFMVILTLLGLFHCFRLKFVILVFIPGALSDTVLVTLNFWFPYFLSSSNDSWFWLVYIIKIIE